MTVRALGCRHVPPFDPDNDFQGNEWMADYLYGTNPSTYTTSSIDRSGVTSPAPEGVYQTIRYSWSSPYTIYYYLPNIPAGTKTIRLHFAEIYFNNTGDQVFDIVFNGTVVYSNFDILCPNGGV